MTAAGREDRLPGPAGALIDRSRALSFRFDGERIDGLHGDTIASALVASGRWLMSRSFKFHRPRGPVSFAGHEANTLVQVGGEPNVPADLRTVVDGDDVRPLNVVGTLRRDRAAVLGRLSRFLPVGFYYRSFFGSDGSWERWEPKIRALAGLGRVGLLPAHRQFDKQFLHCDVAVVGGGPAGLAAAVAAAEAGADVALFEQLPRIGGSLLTGRLHADAQADAAQRSAWHDRLRLPDSVSVFTSASVTGIFDDRLLSVIAGDRLLKVRARRIVLAHGGIEQFPIFPDNDLPGIALCSGLQRLVRLYGVRPGRQAVVVAADDTGYGAALDLVDAGLGVAAVVDLRGRTAGPADCIEALERAGTRFVDGVTGLQARAARNGLHIGALTILSGAGRSQTFDCDVLAVSAGTVPAYTLAAQAGAAVRYDAAVRNLVVGACPESIGVVGALAGHADLDDAVARAAEAGRCAARAGNLPSGSGRPAAVARVLPAWPIFESGGGKAFVDLDEDLQPDDLRAAVRMGFGDMQLLKRFSTVGMGPSQGRHSALATLRILARETGSEHASVGLATPRPPAGEESVAHLAGRLDHPVRRTALHDRHLELGAVMMPVGAWQRPAYFGTPAARERHIADEVAAVRARAGLFDVGTLGGLLVRGPDAARFLDRLYTGRLATTKPGMVRYALMLDETGTVFDDGVAACLESDAFYVTTTTGHSDSVYRSMLRWNARWRLDLDVTNVTSALCGINLAGPASRAILAKLCPQADLTAQGFGFMRTRTIDVAGARSIVMRVGFLGELSYEIHVPASRAASVHDLLLEAGQPEGLVPIGVEAQRLLRLEKGHLIVGQDTDGVTTPDEAGMGWAVALDKPFFVGQRALRVRGVQPRERVLVCWRAAPGAEVPVAEGHLVLHQGQIAGHVTSVGRSAALGATLGMAFAAPESATPGAMITIKGEGGVLVAVEVVVPPFYDPEGQEAEDVMLPNNPDGAVRRSNLRRLLRDKGLRIVAVDAVEVSEGGPSDGVPREGAPTLADLSTCDRIGLKGRGSTRWLEAHGIALPERPNRLRLSDGGVVVARYGDAEYLLATFRSTKSDVIGEVRTELESTRPAGCHAVPRVDGQAVFGLAGVGCVESLSGLCPADLRPAQFGPQDILQTLCAGVSAQVLNLSADGAPRIVVLCDASYAYHLFAALSDAVSSAGGAITAQSAWFESF